MVRPMVASAEPRQTFHRPLQLIGERRVEGRQTLRRQHEDGDEDAAERRWRTEMVDAEVDNDGKEGRHRHR
jgi:hypothetical protein